jgi:hypothetical protein
VIRYWVLAVVAASSLACAVRVERAGNERLLDPRFDWRPGRCTAEQVARDLGPPDEIREGGDGMEFVYRFEHRRHSRFLLSYVFKLLTHDSDALQSRVLVVSFDAGNQLLRYQLLAPLSPTILRREGRVRP